MRMFITKYAIIEIADKQFIVSEGEEIKVYKSSTLNNFNTLLFKDGDELALGMPFLEQGGVQLTYTGDKKIKTNVNRFKGKSRYRVNKSHSDTYAVLKVTKLDLKIKNTLVEKTETEVVKKVVEKKESKTVKTVKKTPVKKTKTVKSAKSVKTKGVKK